MDGPDFLKYLGLSETSSESGRFKLKNEFIKQA